MRPGLDAGSPRLEARGGADVADGSARGSKGEIIHPLVEAVGRIRTGHVNILLRCGQTRAGKRRISECRDAIPRLS